LFIQPIKQRLTFLILCIGFVSASYLLHLTFNQPSLPITKNSYPSSPDEPQIIFVGFENGKTVFQLINPLTNTLRYYGSYPLYDCFPEDRCYQFSPSYKLQYLKQSKWYDVPSRCVAACEESFPRVTESITKFYVYPTSQSAMIRVGILYRSDLTTERIVWSEPVKIPPYKLASIKLNELSNQVTSAFNRFINEVKRRV